MLIVSIYVFLIKICLYMDKNFKESTRNGYRLTAMFEFFSSEWLYKWLICRRYANMVHSRLELAFQ